MTPAVRPPRTSTRSARARNLVILVVLVLAWPLGVAVGTTTSAEATQPGVNGRIWWVTSGSAGGVSYRDPGGSTMSQPATDGAASGTFGGLSVSKDARKVAFVKSVSGATDIFVSTDGGPAVNITRDVAPAVNSEPSFCGDDSIVYARYAGGTAYSTERIWSMALDGSNKTQIGPASETSAPACGSTPATAVWNQGAPCPDGTPNSTCTQLARNGGLIATGGVRFTRMTAADISPDGTRIAFSGLRFGDSFSEQGTFVMPSGGGVPARVYNDPSRSPVDVTWSPDGRYLLVSLDSGTTLRIDADPTTEDAFEPTPAGPFMVWSPGGGSAPPSGPPETPSAPPATPASASAGTAPSACAAAGDGLRQAGAAVAPARSKVANATKKLRKLKKNDAPQSKVRSAKAKRSAARARLRDATATVAAATARRDDAC